jgi:hypothetical protein
MPILNAFDHFVESMNAMIDFYQLGKNPPHHIISKVSKIFLLLLTHFYHSTKSTHRFIRCSAMHLLCRYDLENDSSAITFNLQRITTSVSNQGYDFHGSCSSWDCHGGHMFAARTLPHHTTHHNQDQAYSYSPSRYSV